MLQQLALNVHVKHSVYFDVGFKLILSNPNKTVSKELKVDAECLEIHLTVKIYAQH